MVNFSSISRALLALGTWALLGTSFVSTANAETIDFGQHVLGTAGDVETISLENDDEDWHLAGPTIIDGADADVFSVESDGCSNRYFLAGAICELTVRFRPVRLPAPGRRDMSAHLVVVNAGGGDELLSLDLLAEVVPPPRPARLVAEPRGLRLAPVVVGEVGRPERFSARNGGDVEARVGQLSIVGPGASQFSLVSDGCVSMVLRPIFGQCSFELSFRPTQEGTHTASLVVSGWDEAMTKLPIVATATRPDVADGLRLNAWNAALKVAGRGLGRRLSRSSMSLGAHGWPMAGQLDSSLAIRLRGRKRVLATGRQAVTAAGVEELRLNRVPGAVRVLRRASRNAVAILRLTLTEPSGRQTVGVRRLRVRGGALSRDGSRRSRPARG